MAFVGDLERLISFIQEMKEHPLVKLQLERSGLSAEEITDYESFKKIKPLSKFELSKIQNGQVPFGSLVNKSDVTKIYQSPGPIFNVKGEDFEHYRFYKAFEKAGFTAEDVVVNTFSYHISPAGEMFDEACKKIGAAVFPLGIADTETGVSFIKQTKATAFVGVKTYLVKCLKELGDENTIKKAYLIAEKLTEADRAMIKAEFGVEAYQGYGTAELGLISTECSSYAMHVETDRIFLETLDHATAEPAEFGETAEAVASFMSPVTPFIRLATGDLTILSDEKCECGDSTGYILGIFGRADSSVKVKGVFIHFWQADELFKSLGVAGQIIISTGADGVDLIDVKTSAESTAVADEFKKVFKLRLNSVEVDDKIEKTEIIDNRENLSEK